LTILINLITPNQQPNACFKASKSENTLSTSKIQCLSFKKTRKKIVKQAFKSSIMNPTIEVIVKEDFPGSAELKSVWVLC
jgi:hypothetical protein